MTLSSDIVKREQNPISFNEIMKVLRGLVNPSFKELDSLPDDPSMHDIFEGKETCCLLCNLHNPDGSQSDTNHWICMIDKRDEGFVDYFDSLGNSPKQLTKHLNGSNALVNFTQKYKLRYASKKLQKYSGHVNTCGMHVCVRLLKKNMTPKDYNHWLTHAWISADIAVSMLCYIDLLHGTKK